MSHPLTPPPSSPQTHQYEYHKGSPSQVPPSPPQSLSTEEVQMPLQLHNKSYPGDNLSVSIPPAAHNLSACVKHSHAKFTPYSKPSAIKLHFAEKQLHALTTAWEIKAINHWRDFLLAMQEEETQFLQSTKDLQFFKDIMEHHSVSQLEEEEEYHIGAYGQDLTLLALEDEHLNQMEEVTGKLKDNKVLDSKDNLMAFLATSINVDESDTDMSEEDESKN
ncbi:hypothetical protein F5J12DRAFT_899883 [Pisolithus orientalis]|uniref:uncharacterized protein n=1 Tax=Pisolithus orientalis TaxID=936130 RepID=UPI00222466D6|nr:uncharacterized protein F5J12DRAFT_899883 [Pisolithus orientalis]KAI5983006.1 hypothetical protein F5J12DRAFT_899883 [Pisolithus orientalis]